MTWPEMIWDDSEGGNVEHIAEHGLSIDDVENAVWHAVDQSTSRSSNRTLFRGHALDGRRIVVVVEWIDSLTLQPITAYEVEE